MLMGCPVNIESMKEYSGLNHDGNMDTLGRSNTTNSHTSNTHRFVIHKINTHYDAHTLCCIWIKGQLPHSTVIK